MLVASSVLYVYRHRYLINFQRHELDLQWSLQQDCKGKARGHTKEAKCCHATVIYFMRLPIFVKPFLFFLCFGELPVWGFGFFFLHIGAVVNHEEEQYGES